MSDVWKIEKYARYLTTGLPGRGQWKQYDDCDRDLVLTLTDSSNLVLCHGTTVMESHSLVTARAWMRAMTKRDSMLIMYKVKNETRRFRLKFHGVNGKTADEQCSRCGESLSQYFPVKIATEMTSCSQNTDAAQGQDQSQSQECAEGQDSRRPIERLEGEVTLGKLAQVVTGQINVRLPLAYQHCNVRPEDVDTVIRLCLTDPTFPAFVQQVDQQLQKIISDSSET